MTTTATAPEIAGRTRPSRPVLAPLAAAGACWTAGQGLLPDMGTEWPERYDAVAADRGLEAAATVLLFVAGASLVVAAIALARTFAGSHRRLVTVGTVLLGLGGVWLCAGRAAFNLVLLAATAPGVSREQGLAVLTSETPAFAVFPLTLLALLLGPLLLGIAVRRSTWLPLVLWVLGIALFVATEFQVKAGETAGIAIASAGLVLLGRTLVRQDG